MFANAERWGGLSFCLALIGLVGALGADYPSRPGSGNGADPRCAELAKEVRDKGRIVYGARTAKNDWDLFTMRPDGSDTQKLTNTPEFNEGLARLTWSPDGKWLAGVASSFDTGWSVVRMDAATGEINPVSTVDCCTPDWFPDSRTIIYSNRPHDWTQLWMADGEGENRRLVFAEDGRHVYGGCVSPDGDYVLFTGNKEEDGDPLNAGAPMGLLRFRDAPTILGVSPTARKEHPDAKDGPVLPLPAGWEPHWTSAKPEATK
jgi:Tol biopolymer transport system component